MMELKITFRSLEKHVCNLKWSTRLWQLGIRQDTFFHWIYDKKNEIWEVTWTNYFDEDENHYAAFTVQDFVDLFPRFFKISRSDNEWKFYCEAADMHLENEDNMANVFARILVAITKNKTTEKDKKKLIIIKGNKDE